MVPRLPRQAWIVLGGDLLSALGSGLTMPFFVVYLHRVRGVELAVATLALSTIAVASFAGNLIGGSFADRVGPRRTLAAGLVCSAAGAAWLAFVTSAPAAFGAAACLGLGNSIAWPAFDSLLATAVAEEERPRAFALRHATLNLGFGGGALVAAGLVVLDSTRSFQLLYLVDAATFAAAALPLLLLVRSLGNQPEARAQEAAGGYREVLHDRAFLAIWGLTALLVALGFGQYEAAIPAFATGTAHVSAHALGYVFAANTLAVVVLQLLVLRIVERGRRTTALAAGSLAFGCAWCIALVAGHAGGGAVGLFALAMAVLGLGETLLSPALGPIVNDLAPDRLRGRYNGTFVLAYTTGFTVGPELAGVGLRIGDGSAWFAVVAAGCVLASGWSLTLGRRLPAPATVPA